jgi:hypothetical protein
VRSRSRIGRLGLDRRELAQLALDAEVTRHGVPGGLMDQLCSLFGERGHALLIDCATLSIEPVALPPGIAVLCRTCGLPRVLAGSEYASRAAECEAIAARLGLRSLRDATLEQVADEPRARHVVSENARVLATADALRAGDLAALGSLLRASHASLRDDYAVSTHELDLLVELLIESGAPGRAPHRRRVRWRAWLRSCSATTPTTSPPRPPCVTASGPASSRWRSSPTPSTAPAKSRLSALSASSLLLRRRGRHQVDAEQVVGRRLVDLRRDARVQLRGLTLARVRRPEVVVLDAVDAQRRDFDNGAICTSWPASFARAM